MKTQEERRSSTIRRAVLVALFVGVPSAYAVLGEASYTSLGNVPTNAVTHGVDLTGAVGCRMSAYMADGGRIGGGTLQWYYYSASSGLWAPGDPVFDCTRTAGRILNDAGNPAVFVCPDLEPLVKVGRVAGVATNLTAHDGGPANGALVRTECWGPTINGPVYTGGP